MVASQAFEGVLQLHFGWAFVPSKVWTGVSFYAVVGPCGQGYVVDEGERILLGNGFEFVTGWSVTGVPHEVLGQLKSPTFLRRCFWHTSLNHVDLSGDFLGVQKVLINTVG